MRKLLSIVILSVGLMGCKKEEVTPNNTCNCGMIMNDSASNYSVDIKNDCSGNVKTFYLSEADWMTAYVGTNYCITNVANW